MLCDYFCPLKKFCWWVAFHSSEAHSLFEHCLAPVHFGIMCNCRLMLTISCIPAFLLKVLTKWIACGCTFSLMVNCSSGVCCESANVRGLGTGVICFCCSCDFLRNSQGVCVDLISILSVTFSYSLKVYVIIFTHVHAHTFTCIYIP